MPALTPLAPEDALRLNVLLANRPLAIRIDESRLRVHGLTAKGESEIPLHPTCRDDRYIKAVKELLSGHVLGSPGGYPVYLQRWTRMGQMRDESLEQLLVLGEPEAVVAAVCAPGLTDELARRAWWAMEDAENARQMLMKPAVAAGSMGPELADYLVEHLPFETETDRIIETVRLVLQPGLIDAQRRAELWQKGQRKSAILVGFIAAIPDGLPLDVPAHPLRADCPCALADAEHADGAEAQVLCRALSASGQGFLQTVAAILKKPGDQEIVNRTLDITAAYFAPLRAAEGPVDKTLEALSAEADAWLAERLRDPALAAMGAAAPKGLAARLRACHILSGLSYGAVRPVFKGSTATGSLMRRKLAPVLEPLNAELNLLLHAD